MTLKKKYVNNADLMAEVHKSKTSYASYLVPHYANYDAFVTLPKDITRQLVDEVRLKKSRPHGGVKVDPATIPDEDVVFRVMTYEHVPKATPTKLKARKADGDHSRTNFGPYKHYVLTEAGPKEVCRSHWVGGFDNGHFSTAHGRITPTLGKMMYVLVENYAKRPNWANYSYLDEMKATALVQLSQVILQFAEERGSNPFAYLTQITSNCFLRVLKQEKTVSNIRDDMLEIAGSLPSFARQNRDIDTRR